MTRSLLIAAAAACLAASAARAQTPTMLDPKTVDDWRAVDLESGVSMEVPRAVGEAYRPADPADPGLALFRVGVKDAGDLTCGLDRLAFDKPPLGMARKRALDFFTAANPGIFCHGVGTEVRERSLQVMTSGQGYPGSRCVASYADVRNGQAEGDVVQARTLVGKDAVYVLTCTVRDLDQARAETNWEDIWSPRIRHVEDSLKLP